MKKALKTAVSLLLTIAVVFGISAGADFGANKASADTSINNKQIEAINVSAEKIRAEFESVESVGGVEAYAVSGSFDSGSGTEADPYIISTKEQLALVNNYLDCSFKLANDIVFTESDFAEGGRFFNNDEGWQPIGENSAFTGTFDGNNHVIKGLEVYAGYNTRYAGSHGERVISGLFGVVFGEIKNLGLVDCSVYGMAYNIPTVITGGIAAMAGEGAVISDCYVTGDVAALIESDYAVTPSNKYFERMIVAGGIVGAGDGSLKIIDCYNKSDVAIVNMANIVPSNYYNAEINLMGVSGGITGGYAIIDSCYNSGAVKVGVGAYDEGSSQYYPTDEMFYNVMSGGISGYASKIKNCYNNGEVLVQVADGFMSRNTTTVDIAGGIVAALSDATVSDCYNTGSVSGSSIDFNYGIAAFVQEGGIVENCYYLNNVTSGGYNDGGRVSAKKCTVTEMKTKSTYTGFDFEDTWYYVANKEPQLIGTNPKHMVTWNVDGEKTEALVAEMEKMVAPADPEKEGYTFVGWTPAVPDKMPANDITFTAEWVVNCTHSYTSAITMPATCTENGVKTYTCTECGDVYTESIPATGHNEGTWEVVTNSSCTSVGEKVKKCTVCGIVLETKEIAMTEHIAGTWQITENATCTEIGEKVKKCLNCNIVLETGTVPATGHTAGAWETTVEPTTETEGKKVKKCTACGLTLEEATIAKLPKEPVKDNAVVNTPSTSTINYGDAIILHVDESKIPAGGRVEWTASNGNFSYKANGATCEISPEKSGDTTFTATIYDADGNPVSVDEQTMTSKAGFFQKIIAFFKKLFGLTKTIPNFFKF